MKKKVHIISKYTYQTYPVPKTAPEFEEADLEEIGKTKCFDLATKTIIDCDCKELKARDIRVQRDEEVFPIINRGAAWYATLTEEQSLELQAWYQAWLDAPDTLVIPTKPSWLK